MRFSDYIFSVLALVIAIGGVFASEYHYDDYQIGALAAAMGIVTLWILYDAALRQGWWEKIQNSLSDSCDCGGREYQRVGSTFLSNLLIWAHFYCPDCKRFFKKLIPMSLQYLHRDSP